MNDCRALRGRSYLLAALLASLLPYAGAARDSSAAQGAGAVRDAAPQELRGAEVPGAGSAKSTVIYVVRRGWHIDVGFAAADIQPPLNSVAGQFPGVRYLFFGFGDRHYLLAKDRNAPVSLGALWPGPGMILATALRSSPQDAFGTTHVVALAVTDEQTRNAQAFIWRSFGRQSNEGQSNEGQSKDDSQSQSKDGGHDRGNGAVQNYGPGPYEGSLYFTAAPRYSALHTCNTWAAQSLAALPIHSAGVLFAGQLWSQVRRLAKKQSAGGVNGTDRLEDTTQLHGADQLHGGLVPSWHTTVVPEF
jgi:hypothetical protein